MAGPRAGPATAFVRAARVARVARGMAAGTGVALTTAALLEPREAADSASGEWWSPARSERRIAAAEERGHPAPAGRHQGGRSVTTA